MPLLRPVRAFVLALLFYIVIASLIIGPAISKARTASDVHKQFIAVKQSVQSEPKVVPTISGLPVQMTIARLAIDFQVAKGYYNISTKKWTLDSRHVFVNAYTNKTPIISTKQAQDVVIYGHNFDNVIGRTSQLVPGDIMLIDTDTGYEFRYYFVKADTVVPTNTSILNLTDKQYPVLLVTCTGSWDQIRRVMYFAPIGQPYKKGVVQ